ncbi:MAG: hypothetical protein VX738_01410 [Planctomycetota bacterium]|nr:hypothetical protein [Planctomycetota bacterium]
MIQIRPFLNTDPPALASVINNCCQIEAPVSASLLEHAVYSKICFTRDRLLVATHKNQIVGFVHLGSRYSDDAETSTLTISNILFPENDVETATALVRASANFAKELGFTRLRIGAPPERAEYYNGISTHFLNVGVPDSHPVLPVLKSIGFRDVDAWICYRCDPKVVRIPFRREHMLYRRSHEIVQVIEPTFDSIKSNHIFSHLANSELRLVTRDPASITARLIYASLSHSYPGWPSGGVDVLGFLPTVKQKDNAVYEYLLCELLRQLPDADMTPLRVHLPESNVDRIRVIKTLGFAHLIRSVHIELDLTPVDFT